MVVAVVDVVVVGGGGWWVRVMVGGGWEKETIVGLCGATATCAQVGCGRGHTYTCLENEFYRSMVWHNRVTVRFRQTCLSGIVKGNPLEGTAGETQPGGP